MKKVLIIGNGAREHVIAETLKRSPQKVHVVTFGKANNPGLAKLSDAYEIGDLHDLHAIKAFAEKQKPDFAIVGPEDPIAHGVVDALLEIGIKSASPLQTVGKLESSKAFTRELLEKYNISGNPKYKVFYSSKGMKEFMHELYGDFVVKADGLQGGKGVKVMGDHFEDIEQGFAFAKDCLSKDGKVIVEEKFIGQEFSLMSLVDGKHVVDTPPVQDHKRAFEQDKGPNTGGMGSYSDADSSLPFLEVKDVKAAHQMTEETLKALHKETGIEFKGVMYGGFIATRDGVRLIEYNARFGDPEVMNVLPILKTDFVLICEAMIGGYLDQIKMEFEKKATVCKYLVPKGYPDNPIKGAKIKIGKLPPKVKMYYAAVDEKDGEIFLSSSRTLAFVGIADTLKEAEEIAQSAISAVEGPVFYRKDIGTADLIQTRVEMMKSLRVK